MIGSVDIDDQQAISIPVRYSKATSKAKAQSTKKAWKPALEQQPAPRLKPEYYQSMQAKFGSQSNSQAPSQSQTQRKPTESQLIEASKAGFASSGSQGLANSFTTGQVPPSTTMVDPKDRYSAEVKGYTKYVIKRDNGPNEAEPSQATQASGRTVVDGILSMRAGLDDEQDEEADEGDKEPQYETVEKTDLVKGYRFGASYIPVEDELFEPMVTSKGIEVLNFFPSSGVCACRQACGLADLLR